MRLLITVMLYMGTLVISNQLDTILKLYRGHYPSSYCQFSDVIFTPKRKSFLYKADAALHEECHGVSDIWSLTNVSSLDGASCEEVYDIGHVYTIYYWAGGSNYFHLHYDMMIPLYSAAYLQLDRDPTTQVTRQLFMPTVETSRLQEMNWDTNAFDSVHKYWMQMTQIITGEQDCKPLHNKILEAGNNICFRKIYFGTKSVKFDDSDLILKYVDFVKKSLNIAEAEDSGERVAIIHRSNRRRILNEDELLTALNKFVKTDLIEFSGLSFSDQVLLVQNYTVLVGMNGAGLTNALYLRPHAVAVQLVPYQAGLNYREFAQLLRARGPYLEWHNVHQELTRAAVNDPYKHNSDTIVHVQEITDLIAQALTITSETGNKQHQRVEL